MSMSSSTPLGRVTAKLAERLGLLLGFGPTKPPVPSVITAFTITAGSPTPASPSAPCATALPARKRKASGSKSTRKTRPIWLISQQNSSTQEWAAHLKATYGIKYPMAEDDIATQTFGEIERYPDFAK